MVSNPISIDVDQPVFPEDVIAIAGMNVILRLFDQPRAEWVPMDIV